MALDNRCWQAPWRGSVHSPYAVCRSSPRRATTRHNVCSSVPGFWFNALKCGITNGMKSQPDYFIPFNRPCLVGKQMSVGADAVASGQISGDAYYTRRCHTLLEESLGVGKVLLTTSCTHALEMAALLLDIQPGDEVIVPSFTFVSTANAFVLRGARPVFIDVRPDTLNVDERQLAGLITPSTKAIVVVHYAGVACEMDAIMETAGRAGIPVIEDNAHGLFGCYKGRPLGSFGSMAT